MFPERFPQTTTEQRNSQIKLGLNWDLSWILQSLKPLTFDLLTDGFISSGSVWRSSGRRAGPTEHL